MNSTYWLNTIMRTIYTNSSGKFYVGLSSTMPSQDGSGVSEPKGGNYARVEIDAFSTPENGTVKSMKAIQFPRSSAQWFSVDNKARYWVIFDGNTSGAKLLSAGELDAPRVIDNNTQVTITAETLSITLTDSPTESV